MILPEYNPFYYKPLPKEITIRESDIEGLGIFATMNILEGKDLGKTHIKVPQFKGFIRTPIGGFITGVVLILFFNRKNNKNNNKNKIKIKRSKKGPWEQ